MPPARFDHAGGSVVFSRGPGYPERSLDLLQATARSTGGDPFGHDPVAAEDLIPLAWRGMPTAERDQLLAFAADTVDWMAEPFTYTDTAGVATAVRLAAAEIAHEEIAHGRHAVTLTLMRS